MFSGNKVIHFQPRLQTLAQNQAKQKPKELEDSIKFEEISPLGVKYYLPLLSFKKHKI